MKRSEGILIRRAPLTETSLLIHWCTPDAGLLKTVARGGRAVRSPFSGRLDLFLSAEIDWAAGRRDDLHALRGVEVLNHRAGLRHHWLRVLAASYFVRLLEVTTERETPVEPQFDLLRRALDWLDVNDPSLVALKHYERELARILGVESSDGDPSAGLRQHCHGWPEPREKLVKEMGRRHPPAT